MFSHTPAVKVFVTLVFVLASCTSARSQLDSGVWEKKIVFPEYYVIHFFIGNRFYVGSNLKSRKFWEFNVDTRQLTRKADFPGRLRDIGVSMAIKGKGYFGTGRATTNGLQLFNDLWEYDPITDQWKEKSPFPGGERYNAMGFSLDDAGYLGMGYNGTYLKDLWKYNPNDDSWVELTSMPRSARGRESPTVFQIGNKVYVGSGKVGFDGTCASDFWEYDVEKDGWAKKADLPANARASGVGFTARYRGYTGGGNNWQRDIWPDFWEYNPCEDKWIRLSDLEFAAYGVGSGFQFSDRGFVLAIEDKVKASLWEYKPQSSSPIPLITDIEPRSGESGTLVSIRGQNFSVAPEKNLVEMNGVSARIESNNPTTITAIVPLNSTTGFIQLQVDCNQVVASPYAFIVTLPPPMWLQWWALSVYGFLFIGFLVVGRRMVSDRERKKFKLELERKQMEALRELDHLKTKFFSNITHEFRTPLTLIKGPAKALYEKERDPESRQMLNLIQNNSDRLLKLINQLLDLAKLDAHEMKLNLAVVDLGEMVRSTASQFTSMATSRGVAYEVLVEEDMPLVLADGAKLETVLSNLISNAMKFTSQGGQVTVAANWIGGTLELRVGDNGRGIAPEALEHVFDRFYQVNPTDSSHSEGTGIGLALVKEYTELMRGKLDVESHVDAGTVFTVSLRLQETNEATPASDSKGLVENLPAIDVGPDASDMKSEQKPLVLLVEDNADIMLFVRNCLGDRYRFKEASDGQAGLAMAREEVPDLIISDWMMPEMDGLELCNQIKKDLRTDHIPFIMLTAKAAHEHKMEGLQTGADDYLIKPFDKEEIALKVQNLLTLREKLQAHLHHHLLSRATPVEAISLEERFILKAKAFVESNMANENMSVDALAEEMALSREQCYRKLMALTGLSPSAFIRRLRLQRAAQLVSSKWGSVSQVAYEVGFENLSHFSKAFKEEFGKLPSEY